MPDLLPLLLSFPPEKKVSAGEYDKQVRAYLHELSCVPLKAWTTTLDKQSLLDLLNPAVNTLPYLASLWEHTRSVGKDARKYDALIHRLTLFFTTFDPVQVRYAGEQWRNLYHCALDAFIHTRTPDLTPLSTALLRLDPTAGTFTTSHLLFVRACLEAGALRQALPILDKPIYAFPQSNPKPIPDDLLSDEYDLSNAYLTPRSAFSHKLQPEYVLEYYLLGAHIAIGLRSWSRARLWLEYVILTPSAQHAVSALQVEAYKKWVLVGLLAEGKLFPYPRTANPQVIKSTKAIAKPYEVLAEDFEKRDWKKFQAEMDMGAQIWQEDGNFRLVNEAADALLRYRVVDLQKTYAALHVSRVASHLTFNPDATLQLLSDMIRSNHLNASITPGATAGDAVLRFHTSTTIATSDHELEARTTRINSLIHYIRDADRRLQLTKEYIEVAKRTKRAGGDGELADQMDLTWDAPGGGGGSIGPMTQFEEEGEEGDEDIMGF